MTYEEFQELYPNSVIFSNPDYKDAIAGVTDDGNVLYDFDKMVECLMKEDGCEEIDAIDFIDYNTIRSIPYADDPKPIIFYPISS